MYGTLELSKTYHAARGNTAWASAEDANLTIALLRGSEFIDQAYASQFPGWKTGRRQQVREWPRTDAWDNDENPIDSGEIPDEVINATYEAALRELAIPGSLRPDYVIANRVKAQRVEGAVSREFFPGTGTGMDMATMVPIINGILSPILTGESSSSALSGKAERTY